MGASGNGSKIDHLAFAAQKAATRRDFVAFFLEAFRRAERMSEADLLNQLECQREDLYRLSLAKAPQPENPSFGSEVRQIAEWANVSALELIRILRRVHALHHLSEAENAAGGTGILAAARDRDSTRHGEEYDNDAAPRD